MATIQRINPTNRNVVPGIGTDNNIFVKSGDINPLIDQVNTNTTAIADFADGSYKFDHIAELTSGHGITLDNSLNAPVTVKTSAALNGVVVSNATTGYGISVTSTTTDAINISGSATVGLDIETGTFGTGIRLAGTQTNGLIIGDCGTSAISLTGTNTYGLYMVGSNTTAISIEGTNTNAIAVTSGTIQSTFAPVSYAGGPSLGVGKHGVANAVVDAAASDNIAFTVNMKTGVNKTSAGDSCMAAYVGIANTADGANTRLQGILIGPTVAFDCYDAYGLQSNMSIAAGVNATGNLTAVSGKVTVAADSITGGIISAGLFTLDGAFDPTATTYGIWIDNVGITSDAGIEMNNNGGTIVSALKFDGCATITTFATFNADTASKCIAPNTSAINALTAKKAIKVMVGASEYWIPCFSCTDGTGSTFN